MYKIILTWLLGTVLSLGLVMSVQADNRLGGISTRSFVQTDSANYMIAGVLITGSSKRIVVRASSVDGVLNPLLEVQSYPDGNLLYSNDNWATDPSATELQQTGWTPAGSSDAAMIITLSPGLYTMQVSPVDKPGVGLIEVYELDSTESPKLGGISTRSFVQTDSMNYMIAGLFVSGSAKRVVVRASGVVDGMLDPILEVQSYPDGNLLYSNDNWGTDPSATELQQLGWSPARSLDAAMIVTLQPGLYTMQVSPKSSPGIGLIEVYELPELAVADIPKYSSEPVSGSTIDFGSASVGTLITYNLLVSEEGDADLVLNSSSISGTNANDFKVLTTFPLTLPDNAVYVQAPSITIQCTPSSEGLRTASLQISSNVGDYTYNLQCTGISTTGEPAEFIGIVATHNEWRQQVGVANLTWSNEVAQVAQAWADDLQSRDCPLEHNPDRGNYGENAYKSFGSSPTPESVVDYWASEITDYDYNTNSCQTGKQCGHYTQVIWADTLEVGCGKASCGSQQVWICNYSPPGNYVGQKPY